MNKAIQLQRGMQCIVSDEDFERIAAFHWHMSDRGYVCRFEGGSRSGLRRKIYLHRQIMDAPAGVDVDHINGDRLDNRRENLRLASRSENLRNRSSTPGSRSRFKGVHRCPSTGQWAAKLSIKGRVIWLGRHDTEEAAARAYNAAALKHHGAFARLNDLPKE